MDLGTSKNIYWKTWLDKSAQRTTVQDQLINKLDDTVTTIQQHEDPPGSELRAELDLTKAAIKKNPDAADALRALLDLTDKVIDTLGGLEPKAPIR